MASQEGCTGAPESSSSAAAVAQSKCGVDVKQYFKDNELYLKSLIWEDPAKAEVLFQFQPIGESVNIPEKAGAKIEAEGCLMSRDISSVSYIYNFTLSCDFVLTHNF